MNGWRGHLSENDKHQLYSYFSSPLTVLKMPEAIQFYEADQGLKAEDRKQIVSDINSILWASTRWSILGGIAGFSIPTLASLREQKKLKEVIAEKTKGAPFKVFVVRPPIRAPFFSMFLGFLTYSLTKASAYTYKFERKKQKMAATASDDETQERLSKVWSLMQPPASGFWLAYFDFSARDPSFIMGDPRTATERLSTDPKYKQANAARPVLADPNGPQGNSSEWEHIREANFPQSSPDRSDSFSSPDAQVDMVQEPVYGTDKPQVGNTKPRSRWDEIREGK